MASESHRQIPKMALGKGFRLLPSFSSNWGSSGTIESLKLRNYRISQELNKLFYASGIGKHDKSVLYILASSLVFKERKLQRLTEEKDGSASVDPFLAVMNKEYNGQRRLFGRGVIKKLIKKVNGSETSYMVPGELMESVRTDIDAELNRLVEMQKQIEDDHERKKLEIT
ncbi:hypothetical protein Tco_0149730 [Tanacetum coccineum]